MFNQARQEPTPRIPFDAPVTVTRQGQAPLQLQAINLGPGGIFVGCQRPLPEGERVTVAFALPAGQGIRCEAQVIRTDTQRHPWQPCGMALRFEQLDARARQLLQLVMDDVEQLQGSARLVEPEEEPTDPVLSDEFVNFSLSLRSRTPLE